MPMLESGLLVGEVGLPINEPSGIRCIPAGTSSCVPIFILIDLSVGVVLSVGSVLSVGLVVSVGSVFSVGLVPSVGFVLSVGLVVDDAIVVVENVQRHIREGHSKIQSALIGARELFGPIVAIIFVFIKFCKLMVIDII